MNYYIFRHGLTYETKNRVPYGSHQFTAEILDEGKPALKKMASFLKDISTDANYSSELLRVKQTTEIISKTTGWTFQTDKRINEYLDHEEFTNLRNRVQDFLDEMNKKSSQTIAICTHGAVISALKHLITSGRYEKKDLMDFVEPAQVLIIKGKEVEVMDFNH